MIGLKEACQIILSKHPGQYIHIANEYKDVYAFILMNEGERVTETTGILFMSTVDKTTGNVVDNLLGHEAVFKGDFKQYTRKDIEGL